MKDHAIATEMSPRWVLVQLIMKVVKQLLTSPIEFHVEYYDLSCNLPIEVIEMYK